MTSKLDIAGNRRATKYTRLELMRRVLWMPGRLLFLLIPRPFFGIRAALLRLFGASIGRDVHIYPSAHIYMPWNLSAADGASIGEFVLVYNLGPVEIGARATVSHKAHLCAGTHDYADPELPLIKSRIWIGEDAWVCADAFVGPDVRVHAGAVVAARAVAVADVPEWTVVGGNPARVLKRRELRVPGA